MICELLFPSSILAVKLNRATLVVVLENEIYIYNISNMRLLHVIETTPNPEGECSKVLELSYGFLTEYEAVCALSPLSDSSYLAYPSPVPSPTSPLSQQPTPSTPPSASTQQSGDIIVFCTRKLLVENVIQAHKSPISFLSINSSGTMLASASDKGTVIRVWSIPGSEKLYQFRRGTRETRIYSMSFNTMSTLLAVSSAHDTVHIFNLGSQKAGLQSNKPEPLQSPTPSIDSRDGGQGMEGGYEAFIDGKKNNGVS